jgi:4-carboxymuconolactone decarboxylase
MSLEERSERGARLLEQMLGPEGAQQVRGAWRGILPDFERYVTEFLAGEIWSRPQLDLRTRSLATIAAVAALGRMRALELNIRMALRNGATGEEIRETLLHIAPYAGSRPRGRHWSRRQGSSMNWTVRDRVAGRKWTTRVAATSDTNERTL